jgi:hypothetical protein
LPYTNDELREYLLSMVPSKLQSEYRKLAPQGNLSTMSLV